MSIMVSSMGGNDVGDVVDGNVASKVGDIGDNGGMTCGGEVFGGGMKEWESGVENSCGMEVSEGGFKYSGGMEVSSVERPAARPPG